MYKVLSFYIYIYMSPNHIYAILREYIWFHVWYLYVQGFVLTYVPNIFFIITKIGLMLYNVLQDHASTLDQPPVGEISLR